MSENDISCPSCGAHSAGRSFCPNCGKFLLAEYDVESFAPYEKRLMRIIENLNIHPHVPISWNEQSDIMSGKIERLMSLSMIDDLSIERREIMRRAADFLRECREPEFQIAFVGTIKTGKSTLINSLLGRNYASMAVTPETAALTKFRYSARDYVNVTFYTADEWQELWSSRREGKGEEDQFMREYRELNADAVKDKWIGHDPKRTELAPREVLAEIAKWSSSKSPEHYFVRELEVGISTLPSDFPKQIVFVDTPGLSDPVAYRTEITKSYIRRANAVFVCVDAQKIYKEEVETLSSVLSMAPAADNGEKPVYLIATHWDILNDPHNDWSEQKAYLIKNFSGPGFFGSEERAKRNIMYASAYIYNLCRDWESISADKLGFDALNAETTDRDKIKRQFQIFALKVGLNIDVNDLRADDLRELRRQTNRDAIDAVIKNTLAKEYAEMMRKKIGTDYHDVLLTVRRGIGDYRAEVEKLIAATRETSEQLARRIKEHQKAANNIAEASSKLAAALEAVEKSTNTRLEKILAKITSGKDEAKKKKNKKGKDEE